VAKKLEPLSLAGVSTYSLKGRRSKVNRLDFGRAWRAGGSFREFLDGLPNILAAADLRQVAAAWIQARRQEHPVILGFGAHALKVGLSPIIIELMRRGLLTAVALNGAGIIHDAEIAMVGQTSRKWKRCWMPHPAWPKKPQVLNQPLMGADQNLGLGGGGSWLQ
jgi:hypothetical protein